MSFDAVRNNQINRLGMLLAQGISANARERVYHRWTALHLAVLHFRPEMITILLHHGANIDAKSREGNTALHLAIKAHRNDLVHQLIWHGANVNIQCQRGMTPFHLGVMNQDMKTAKLLLKNGAKLDTREFSQGQTPLHHAICVGDRKMMKLMLLRYKANVDIVDFEGDTAFLYAARYADAETMNCLVMLLLKANGYSDYDIHLGNMSNSMNNGSNNGSNNTNNGIRLPSSIINRVNRRSGETALMAACQNTNGHNDNDGDTSQHTDGTAIIVTLLLMYGADLNQQDRNGNTAVWHAVQAGKLDVLEILLRHLDADAHTAHPHHGTNALLEAVRMCRSDMVRMLLRSGVSLDLETKQAVGWTTSLQVAIGLEGRDSSDLLYTMLEEHAEYWNHYADVPRTILGDHHRRRILSRDQQHRQPGTAWQWETL